MIKDVLILFVTVTISLLSPVCPADDLLELLNAEANTPALKNSKKESKQPVSSNQVANVRIMDKLAAKDMAYLPKNQNEIEYRNTLKNKYYKTYLQYIKLDLNARDQVHELYAESSFPRIEETQKAIKRYLKLSNAKLK